MNDQETNKELSETENTENRETNTEVREYVFTDTKLSAISSAEMTKTSSDRDENILSLNTAPRFENEPEISGQEDADKLEDPIFKELSEPKLPAIAKENRARLQMQSPTRLNFYWSVKTNPFQTLNRAFGGKTGSYTLVIKLVNQKNGREEIFPVEAEGSWWFNVDADAAYRAELGFYAPNRPFVRVMFSNTVETPRQNPSPNPDYSPNFTVSANQFAEVLDVSGFPQDAFEVALAGDDFEQAETATSKAFSQFVGHKKVGFSSDEIRFALLALASGHTLESLRGQISASLFTFFKENTERLNAENALAALRENFDIFADELEEEFSSPAVFGASLINFPRTSKKTRYLPKFAPLSSFVRHQ